MGKNKVAPSADIRSTRSQRRRTSLAAAVAGVSTAAILLSSGTVALWQDAVKMDGGQIIAGNLDVEKLGTLDWFENSDDVTSKGSPVDLASYKTTPGDSLLGKQKLDIGLEGDNLYATANVTFPTLPSGDLYATPEGVKLTYVVVDRDGNEVAAETPVGQTSAAWNVKNADVSGKIVDNTVDYVVQIKAKFDENTSERTRVQTQAMLGKLQFNIQQVRSPIAAVSTVTKTLSSSTIKAGDEVTVTYTVNNIGAEALNNVTIDDPLLTAAGVDLSSVNIAPGSSHTFTAKIKVTKELSQQAELFNGGVTSTGVAESGEVTSTGGVNTSSNVVEYSADMSIVGSVKINDLNGNGALDYNETVTYSWIVKNTGSDSIKDLNVVAQGNPTSTEAGDLASSASRTFTATYTPTSDDLLSVLNVSATANGLALLDNAPVTASSENVSVNTVKPVPNATFIPTATLSTDKNSDGVANVSDVMTFTAKFTNTGNVALNDVKLSDSLAGVAWDKTTVTTVAPGETITFTGTKTLEAADLASGAVNNNMQVDYVPAASSGSLVDTTKIGSTSTTAVLNTDMTITSTATINNDGGTVGQVDEDETVTYTYTVKNTGEEALKNLKLVTSAGASVNIGDKNDINVGETRTVTYIYTPKAEDFNKGSLSMSANGEALGVLSNKTVKTYSNSNVLTMVQSNIGTASAIAGGVYHTCAIKNGGEVWCAGADSYGQLGNDAANSSNQSTPVKVDGITNAVSLAAGGHHTLALLSDGTVETWGRNDGSQLGDDSAADRFTPVTIPGLINVKQISANDKQSAALLSDGTVKMWGSNNHGQLGLGDKLNRKTPTTIPDLTDVKQLALGHNHSMAVLNNGNVKIWGSNNTGQLGLGDNNDRYTPTILPNLTDVKQMSAGLNYSLALLNDGTVKTWGDNYFKQLGLGDNIGRKTPTTIPSLSNAKQIKSGYYYSMSLLDDGTIATWGYDNNYALGLGEQTEISKPTINNNIYNVKEITAGYDHSMALLNDGVVKAWGRNFEGQLGIGDKTVKKTPVTSLFGK